MKLKYINNPNKLWYEIKIVNKFFKKMIYFLNNIILLVDMIFENFSFVDLHLQNTIEATKNLENEKQNEMIIPDWLLQKPFVNNLQYI